MEDSKDKEKVQNNKKISDVNYNSGFSVEVHNLLDEPKTLQMPNYTTLILDRLYQKDGDNGMHSENLFNTSAVTDKTEIVIVLLYFEYACIAHVSFKYLVEILKSGLDLIKAFDMIKHHLRILLNKEVNGIENIVEMRVEYLGKVKY